MFIDVSYEILAFAVEFLYKKLRNVRKMNVLYVLISLQLPLALSHIRMINCPSSSCTCSHSNIILDRTHASIFDNSPWLDSRTLEERGWVPYEEDSHDGFYVVCFNGSRRLSDVPPFEDFVRPIDELSLKGNNIHTIPDNAFKNMKNVTRIDLSYNIIRYIHKNALAGLEETLKDLSIFNHELHPNEEFVFLEGMVALEVLTIGSRWRGSSTFRSGILPFLPKLRKLDMSEGELTNIEYNAFAMTENLQYLYLKNNRFSTVPSSVKNIQNLKHLDLSNNRLEFLQSEAFARIPSLKELDLSRNLFNSLDRIAPMAFQGVELEKLDLSKIELPGEPQTLTSQFFQHLLHIKSLSLKNWNIQAIKEGTFRMTEQIKRLILSANRQLRFFERDNTNYKMFDGLQNSLRILELEDTGITKVPTDQLEHLRVLRELNLNKNGIHKIEANDFNPLERLYVLKLAENPLKEINKTAFHRLKLHGGAYLDLDMTPISDLEFISHACDFRVVKAYNSMVPCGCHVCHVSPAVNGTCKMPQGFSFKINDPSDRDKYASHYRCDDQIISGAKSFSFSQCWWNAPGSINTNYAQSTAFSNKLFIVIAFLWLLK